MSDYKEIINLAKKDKRIDDLNYAFLKYLSEKPAKAKKANDKRGQPTRDWNGEIHFTAQELKDKFKLDMTRRSIDKRLSQLQKWGYINIMYARHTWNTSPYLHHCITFNTKKHVFEKTREYFEMRYRGVAAKLRAESNGSQKIYSDKKDMFINKHIFLNIIKEDEKIEKNNQKCETVSAQKPEGEMIGIANVNIKSCNSTKNIKISPSKIKYPKLTGREASDILESVFAAVKDHTGWPVPRNDKKLNAYIIHQSKVLGGKENLITYLKSHLRKGGEGILDITPILNFCLSHSEVNAYLKEQAQLQQNSAQEDVNSPNIKLTKKEADEVIDRGLAIIENHVGLTAPHDNKKLRAYIVYNFKKFGEDWDKLTAYIKKSLKKGGKGIRNILGLTLYVFSYEQVDAYLAEQKRLQPQQNTAKSEVIEQPPSPNDLSLAEDIQAKTGQDIENCKRAAATLAYQQDQVNRLEKAKNSQLALIRTNNPRFVVSNAKTHTKKGCACEFYEQNLIKSLLPQLDFAKQRYLKLKQDVFNGKWFIENSHRLTKVPIQTPIPVQTPNADVSDSTTEIHTPVLPVVNSENNFEFNFKTEFENKPVIKSKDKFNLADLIKKTAENCSSKFPKNRIW